jgi:tripartite-type tricarboxylate transporter receptor subunit TctC
MIRKRRRLGVLIGAALLAGMTMTAGVARAQTGNATVKILVGFPPGGVVDAVARAFAEQLHQVAGTTVVVENKTGAAGKIAIDALLSAPAQGDVLAVIPASVLALTPQVVKSATYDSVRDFTALGSLAEYGFGIAAGPASKAGTLQAYKAWAQTNPNASSFGSPGLGTPQHFLGAQLEKLLGVRLAHIPYKGGAAAVTDVIGGQVPLLITTEQLLPPFESQGKLKTLFVTSRARNPKMPNVPTAAEVGLPQLESMDWFGLFARAGTPPAKVAEWRAMVARVVADAKYAEAIRGMGYGLPASQPTDFPKLMTDERSAWTARVRLSGFTAAD